MDIQIGADPEFFLSKGDDWVSAHGMLPGTKTEPYAVKDGAVQVDGMAVEFNIEPARSYRKFQHNINSVLATLRDMIPAEYDFKFVPTAEFSEATCDKMPAEALELGCDPDYNAYTMEQNVRPMVSSFKPGLRTAAGHIHIGWTQDQEVLSIDHFNACAQLTKQLDFYLGLPERVLVEPNQRSELYGDLGAFRPKSYGVEYRVLSNFWLRDPKYAKFVYKQTHKAIDDLLNSGPFDAGGQWSDAPEVYVYECECIPNMLKEWIEENTDWELPYE